MERMMSMGDMNEEELLVAAPGATDAFLRRTMLLGPGERESPVVETGASVDLEEKDEEAEGIICLNASTTMVLPFWFHSPAYESGDGGLQEDSKKLAHLMLERTVHVGATPTPVWERYEADGAQEFSLHFQKLLGIDSGKTTTTFRLRMTPAVQQLFSKPRLWAFCKEGPAVGRLTSWGPIELIIFPHGALITFEVHWVKKNSKKRFSLKELRSWVYLSKFRRVAPGVSRGWTFAIPPLKISEELARQELGHEVFEAVYEDEAVSLASLANFLVKFPSEAGGGNPYRVSRFNYNIHFTTAVLDKAPPEDVFLALRRAIRYQDGSANRVTDTSELLLDDSDIDMVLRRNRFLSACTEGVFAVEISSGTPEDEAFWMLFRGPYKLLFLHVLAEQQVMERLSLLAALAAEQMHLGSNVSLAEKTLTRRRLLDLTKQLVKYLLLLSSDHCGGRTSLRRFFKSLRLCFSIPALVDELRAELLDTLRVVESDYLEERRDFEAAQLAFDKRVQEVEAERERRLSARSDRIQALLSFAGALFLPFSVISGIFGMNNLDLPADASWGWIMGGTGIACAVLFLCVFLYFWITKPNFDDLVVTPMPAMMQQQQSDLAAELKLWQREREVAESRFF